MIRQAAFEGGKRMLKGALHCHTTRSDGHGSPEEVIRLHEALGYDFMALTDHNLYNYKNFAKGSRMTIIPGVERDHRLSAAGVHVFHTVCIGPAREMGNGYEQDERFRGGEFISDQFAYQPILDDYHAHGNMTLYCHPEWSGTPAREFDRLEGNFGMEIWNSGTAIENDMDNDAAYWDELLMQGRRIFGVATDDGHDMNHHGKGWIMLRADNELAAILEALGRGAFYSTCGPEIFDFYVEDGKAVILCSPCRYAGFCCGHMPSALTHGTDVSRAELVVPSAHTYLRGVVCDAEGRKAWTQPIFFAPQAF